MHSLKIAVASGKGGTGKTTVAAALARSLSAVMPTACWDCDVEAPNTHLFLKPALQQVAEAVIRIPEIDPQKCTLCGKCVEVCQFHALAAVGKTIMVFPQLCHGCGSCTWNCPEGAITEIPHPIGVLEAGDTAEDIRFLRGVLTISEPMGTPIIRQLKRLEKPDTGQVVILDAPPGASCSVVETLRGSDFVLLVAEPTPFGLHDLKQMVSITEEMGIPAGIVINRSREPFEPLLQFCAEKSLPVLMEIPYDRRIAEGLAQGSSLEIIYPEYAVRFVALYERITGLVQAQQQTASAAG